MKIIRPNGTVIECSVEEYQTLFRNDTNKIRTSTKESDEDKKAKRRAYMVEYMKTYRGTSNKIKSGKRVSSCRPWTKHEDKILRDCDTLKQMRKQLPSRSKSSIYTRHKNLRNTGYIKHFLMRTRHYRKHNKIRLVNPNDKRIKMMKYVNARRLEIMTEHPYMTRDKAQKLAFQLYRNNIMVKV